MIKKIGLLLLSLFAIFGFGVSFANPIAPEIDYVCSMFENVEIANYKVVVGIDTNEPMMPATGEYEEPQRIFWGMTHTKKKFYEPRANECICGNYSYNSNFMGGDVAKIFLLDKSIDIENITEDEIENLSISFGLINTTCMYHDEIRTYKIVIDDGNELEMKLIKTKSIKRKQELKEKLDIFPIFWLMAVIIETIVLFFIAKTFRKKDELVQEILYEKEEISNKKLLLRGVIPTTITLPLLWFVFPLIIGDGNLYIVVGEILVATIEAIMLKYGLNISRKRAIITSIIGNLFSFLIILLFNLYQNLSLRSIRAINGYTIFFLGFVFIEGIILFSEGKSLKESVSNKKLVLCGLFTPIVDLLLIYFIIRLFDDLLYKNSELLLYIFIITSKLVVDVFIIKGWRKISRKKSILISVLFNSYLVAIFLAFVYFFAK